MAFPTSPFQKTKFNWSNLPSGNYLVRGDLGAVLKACRENGEIVLVDNPEQLRQVDCNLLDERLYYVYIPTSPLKDLPSQPPPPGTYRLIIGREQENYKHPPQGYEYLDARILGTYSPLGEFAQDAPPLEGDEDSNLFSELLQAVYCGKVRKWLMRSNECYRLFSQGRESPFFQFIKAEEAYIYWESLPDLEIKYKALLYGAWLVLLHRRCRAIRYRNGRYYLEGKADPALLDLLGWQKPEYDTIKEGALESRQRLCPFEFMSVDTFCCNG